METTDEKAEVDGVERERGREREGERKKPQITLKKRKKSTTKKENKTENEFDKMNQSSGFFYWKVVRKFHDSF